MSKNYVNLLVLTRRMTCYMGEMIAPTLTLEIFDHAERLLNFHVFLRPCSGGTLQF